MTEMNMRKKGLYLKIKHTKSVNLLSLMTRKKEMKNHSVMTMTATTPIRGTKRTNGTRTKNLPASKRARNTATRGKRGSSRMK